MSKRPLSLPGLLEGGRKAAFLFLMAIALMEVLAQIAAAAALKSVLVGATSGWWAAIGLLLAGGLAAASTWARTVKGERFGLAYVNDVRIALAQQAIQVASGGGPGRFGTIAIRMTGDLTAVKDWANKGICGGSAGLFGLVGGLIAAYVAAGHGGLFAAMVGPALALLFLPLVFQPIEDRIRLRRRARGRLSSRIGNLLLSAPAYAAYGAQRRGISPLKRANEAVLTSSQRELGWSSLLYVPALMTLPSGAAVAVVLESYGVKMTDGVAGWAALLFALSLTALALGLLGTAVAQVAERNIAIARLKDLMRDANQTPSVAPSGHQRLRSGPALSLAVNGEVIVDAGAISSLSVDAADILLPMILEGRANVTVDGQSAASIETRDWARRVAYAGPRRPVPRGTIKQVLAAKRHASEANAQRALSLVGLEDLWDDRKYVLDPHRHDVTQSVTSRLGLARALSHSPRVLIIDDPTLLIDEAFMNRIVSHCGTREVSLILVAYATRSEFTQPE